MSDHASIKKPDYAVTYLLVGSFVVPIVMGCLLRFNNFCSVLYHAFIRPGFDLSNYLYQPAPAGADHQGNYLFLGPYVTTLGIVGWWIIEGIVGFAVAIAIFKFRNRLGNFAEVLWLIIVTLVLVIIDQVLPIIFRT